jgi:hypothetical protein
MRRKTATGVQYTTGAVQNSWVWLIMLLSLFQTGHSEQRPIKGVDLDQDRIISDGKLLCGYVRGRWISGQLNRNQLFISFRLQARQAKFRAFRLKEFFSYSELNEYLVNRNLRRSVDLQRRARREDPLCSQLAAVRTWSPTVSGGIFAPTTIVESVATPTTAPGLSPTPMIIATTVPTGIQILTPTHTPSPTLTSTATITPLPTPNGNQYLIFVSSEQYGANLGGIRGADGICQGLAISAGLSGSFLSVLSDSSSDVSTRFTINAPIHNTRGEVVVANSVNLWGGALDHAIRYDENGNLASTHAWSGSSRYGIRRPSGSSLEYCDNWTNQSTGNTVSVGATTATDSSWIESTSYLGCSVARSVYCIRVSPGSPTPVPTNTPTATATRTQTPTPTPLLGPIAFYEGSIASGLADSGNVNGQAWGDFDNDGDLDVFLSKPGAGNRLYRNNGAGVFLDVAGSAGVAGDSGPNRNPSWGDFDNDGDLDLYISRTNAPNYLYRNNGNGTFTEIAASAGVDLNADCSGCVWVDFDADGDVDIYLLTWNTPNRLFRNNNNGTFTEVAAAAGLALSDQSFSQSWADYDGDGDLDLYIGVFGGSKLYRNNGNGTFSDVTVAAGVPDGTNNPAALDWGDFDNDGNLDLFIDNFFDNSFLYRNLGNGTFTDIASSAGVSDSGTQGRGITLGDFDADGDIDIYQGAQNNNKRLFRNNGNLTHTDIANSVGVSNSGEGGGTSWVDVNNDGDLDLYLLNNNSGTNMLFLNALNPYASTYLRIKVLSGTGGWTQGGVRVTLKTTIAGTPIATRKIDAGTGQSGQSAMPLIFYNLNPALSYDATIFWADGTTTNQTLGTPDGSTRSVCKGVGLC